MAIAANVPPLPSLVVMSQLQKEDLINGESPIAKLLRKFLDPGKDGNLENLDRVRALLGGDVEWQESFSTINGQDIYRGVGAHTPTKLFESSGIRLSYSYSTPQNRALTGSRFIATFDITMAYPPRRCYDYKLAEAALQARFEWSFEAMDVEEDGYLLSATNETITSIRIKKPNIDRDCVESLRLVIIAR